MDNTIPVGMVPEFRWKVPRAVHRAIVSILDRQELQRQHGPGERLPASTLAKLPAGLRQVLDEIERENHRTNAYPSWMLLCAAATAGGAVLGALAAWMRSTKVPVSTTEWVVVVLSGSLAGLILLGLSALQVWGKKHEARRRVPRIWIREHTIGSDGGYYLIMNRLVSLAPPAGIPRELVVRCTVCEAKAGETRFQAIVVNSTADMDRLMPISPDESVGEIMSCLRSWRYLIARGAPIALD
jgi:hypothetical protein